MYEKVYCLPGRIVIIYVFISILWRWWSNFSQQRWQTIIASVSIGVAGGEVKTDDIVITIPNGAFTEVREIIVSEPQEEYPFVDEGITSFRKNWRHTEYLLYANWN